SIKRPEYPTYNSKLDDLCYNSHTLIMAFNTAKLQSKTFSRIPEVVNDFPPNLLISMGMTKTMNCFQTEWNEIGRGENTDKQDFHCLQYKRVGQEKKILIEDIRKLKTHSAPTYDPALKQMNEKYNAGLKQKFWSAWRVVTSQVGWGQCLRSFQRPQHHQTPSWPTEGRSLCLLRAPSRQPHSASPTPSR
uniref:Uncharacterized protein n=1 Tax=Salmo trutta TaxID=8032 RepID=A0A673ZR11_SALTR